MGPWHHGQEIDDGSTLGALKFDSDTALYFRREILRPFLDQYLKDGAPKADVAPVTAFETGTEHLAAPARLAGRAAQRLHGQADAALSARRIEARLRPRPRAGDAAFDEYVSDPAKPVPFRAAARSSRSATTRADLAAMAGRRSARGVRPHRRAGVRLGRADRAGEDQRPAGRQPDRLDQRHRLRLGREADRRLSRRGRRRSRRWAAIS